MRQVATSGTNRRSNRLRFALRTVLVLILGVGVVLTVVDRQVRKLEQVAIDIRELREFGAIVELSAADKETWARLVPDFAGSPTDVRYYGNDTEMHFADEFIEIVERHPTIVNLTFDRTLLQDEEVQRLLRLPLGSLTIGECRIGDNLRAEAATSLTWLALYRTRINDHSLKALGTLPRVEHLDLTRTRVSDRSIAYLAGLPALRSLVIARCKITEQGKDRLQSLRPDVGIQWEPLQN